MSKLECPVIPTPFAPYGLSAFGELCQLESLELGEGCHFRRSWLGATERVVGTVWPARRMQAPQFCLGWVGGRQTRCL